MSTQITIADLAEELCDPRQHTEPIWGWDKNRHRKKIGEHKVVHPGLLVQLHDAIEPLLGGLDDGGSRGVPRSTPPLQLEALDRYIDIEISALTWVGHLGLTPRATPADNVRALVGAPLAGWADDVLADLRRWRSWAATMTGWQSMYTPRAACPVPDCGETGTLRVNLDRPSATCVACRSWWDEQTVGILAQHIATIAPTERVPIRSGRAGHGGWASRVPNGATA